MWKRRSSKPSQSSKGRAELASVQENRNAILGECRRNPFARGSTPFHLEGKKREVDAATPLYRNDGCAYQSGRYLMHAIP